MIKSPIILISLLFLEIGVCAQGTDPGESNQAIEFHYEDIERFRSVLDVAHQKGDTLEAIRHYFDNGSEGMRAWINRYGVKPERILKALRYFPRYYEYLSTLDTVLMSYEEEIKAGLVGLKELYPSE